MTKEFFIEIIENAVQYSKELDRWSDFGINLFELPIATYGWNIFNNLLEITFTNDGIDIINWWLFEKYGFSDTPNELYDENDNIIPTNNIEELWEIVKNYTK